MRWKMATADVVGGNARVRRPDVVGHGFSLTGLSNRPCGRKWRAEFAPHGGQGDQPSIDSGTTGPLASL